MQPDTLMTRKQAADYLTRQNCPVAYSTLANLAANLNQRRGPPFYKDGNRALYSKADLDEWRRKRLIRVE